MQRAPMPDRFDHLRIAPGNFNASLQFYRDVLSWQVTREWSDAFGRRSAELSGGGVRIVLAEAQEADGAGGQAKANPHAPTLHLDIHDAQERFAQIAPGEHILVPPADDDLGMRRFLLRDPDGNLIAFNEMRQKS